MATMLEMAQRMIAGEHPQAPFPALVGMTLTAVEAGRARMEMSVDARHANPMGTLHGGVACTMADSAMGLAYASTLDEHETFTTLELKINFLRPMWNGRLIAEGIVVSRGKTVGLAECTVTDEKGRLIAKASSTCLTLREPQTQRI
jgi:uncharacterized protein (TIGR00369 family)